MGFDELFKGVTFEDSRIPLGGQPADGGNAGNPPPADNSGQPADSPPATVDQKTETSDKQGEKSDTKPGEGDQGKPLPYDQDPKWKKARAAEKTLNEILEKHGLLNAEELAERLERGESLQKLLGSRDAKKVLDDADYANRVRENWDKQKLEKKYADETPEARVERLERENEELRNTHEQFKSSVESREHAKQVIANYNVEVDRVISSLETPLPDTEKTLLKLYLGVDNPANMIDIEDQTAVRKMARESMSRFQTLVQTIKQAAIEEYVAGKSKLAVDTSKGAPASAADGTTRRPTPKDQTADQVFEAGKNEFLEILTQGLAAAK